MMTHYKYIEELLKRFFDGNTSNKEERELYIFFSGKDVPEHLKSYIPVFDFFETGMDKEFNTCRENNPKVKKLTPNYKKWITLTGIAASVLLLVAVFNKVIKNDGTFNPYEGSYIIRNGEKIADIELIRPELEATIAKVFKQQEKLNKILANVNPTDEFDRIKQEIENQYCELVNSFPDEITRKKVSEILNVECY
ncbi:MAG: hypothetical protein LBU57_07805 [Dysgonamonadaceae bacterium]|jgi:hypothetical protein|nr:hypothetical protein [Dysgonamonadaceae bacterium]